MSNRRRRKQKKNYSKKMVFERPSNIKVEDLLDLYMKIIGDMDVNLDIKFDRVSIEISGEKSRVDNVTLRVRRIQAQAEKASLTDNQGYYYYDIELISKVSKHQIQLEYLVDCLMIKGYESSLTEDKTVITTANMDELRIVQRIGQQTIFSVPGDQNKDIQRFIALVHIKTGYEIHFIIEIGLEYEIFGDNDDKLFFKEDKESGLTKMLEILKEDSFDAAEFASISSEEDTDLMSDIGFAGGKIVFVGEGKELEQSTYDQQEKS